MNIAPGQFDADNSAPIGERLRGLRQQHGLTLRELAEKVGVTATALHSWENGRRNPKGKNLQAFANAFKLTKTELLEYVSGNGSDPAAVERSFKGLEASLDRHAQLAEVIAECKRRIAKAAGVAQDRVKVIIEI